MLIDLIGYFASSAWLWLLAWLIVMPGPDSHKGGNS